MGADLIGWRNCQLQRTLGPQGFLQRLKMRAYRSVLEAQVPPEQLEETSVAVIVNGERRDLTYREIRRLAEEMAAGSPECCSCPLTVEGQPLGCYHFVTYPVDVRFEEEVFEFFCSQLPRRDSISDQLYRDIVSRAPAAGSGWHVRRGGPAMPQQGVPGTLAQRPTPLEHRWGGLFRKQRVDSAQLLSTLFVPLPSPPLVVGYARFWRELLEHLDGKLAERMRERGIELGEDGRLKLAVTQQEHDDPRLLAAKMEGDVAALKELEAGTIEEVRAFARMMAALAAHAVDDGWQLLADA